MSKALTNMNCKICVLCKYWNGAIGSTTIVPKMGKVFEYDHNEKQVCFLKRYQMSSWATCTKFENRYK